MRLSLRSGTYVPPVSFLGCCGDGRVRSFELRHDHGSVAVGRGRGRGLSEGAEAKVRSSDGWETVDGSTRVTLRSTEGETETANEARLSVLRREGDTLIVLGDGHSLRFSSIRGVEVATAAEGSISPQSLAAVAGLPEGRRTRLPSVFELETVNGFTQSPLPPHETGVIVNGSTWVTLHSIEGDSQTTNRLRLSALRSEEGALIIPGDSHRLAVEHIWSAELTKPAPARTVGLVVGVVLGTGALATAILFIAAWISYVNTCNSLLSGSGQSRARIRR